MHFSGRGRPWADSRGCVLGLALLLVLPASNTNPSAPSHFCGGCVRPGDPSSRHGRLCESEDSWQQFQKIVPSRSRVRHTGNVKPGMTMMLDLDKCCLYGNGMGIYCCTSASTNLISLSAVLRMPSPPF
ncbi:MAG: hypothetical protein ACPIOQ_66770 [Promethearchaeia archaeon]